MNSSPNKSRILRVIGILIVIIIGGLYSSGTFAPPAEDDATNLPAVAGTQAGDTLSQLEIKGRAPKTGYERELFSGAWAEVEGCDMRNFVLQRDLTNIRLDEDNCIVLSGTLDDPYTAKIITFSRGSTTSSDVQIDHVVALSDAWQKGAQALDEVTRYEFYNDPLNLLAVDGSANMQKGDGDAATWLPPNASFRCDYVTRQIDVKKKYDLWVTRSEYEAIASVLANCKN